MTKLTEVVKKDSSIVYQTAAEYPWRKLNPNPNDVNPIKSMIGADEALYLHWLTRDYYQGLGEIIDGGPLLGGSTVALASGLAKNTYILNKHKRIHSYDLFLYFDGFKDSVLPESNLKEGDSLVPIFLSNTEKYKDYIQEVAGDILNSRWNGQPVEIFFVDLAKTWQINNHIIKEFFGCLLPDRSIIIQQDYFHYYCYWIHLTMQYFSPYFKICHAPDGGSLAFINTQKIPKELLDIDYSNYFTKEQAIALMDAAIAPLQGPWKLLVMTAKIRLLADLKEYELACSLAKEIHSSSNWENWILYDVVQAENHIAADFVFPGIDKQKLIGVSRNYCIMREGEDIYTLPHPLGQAAITGGSGQNNSQLRARTLTELKEQMGEAIHPLAESLPPKLLESFKDHNLVDYDNRVYIIPISLGHINLSKREDRTRPGIIVVETLPQAKELLGLLNSYKGYNLIPHDNRVYAVPVSLGAVDLTNEEDRARPEIIVAGTLEQAETSIDEISFSSPTLLGAYKGYNLVVYSNYTYGLPISLGHIDLTQKEDRERPGIIIANTLQEVRKEIDKVSLPSPKTTENPRNSGASTKYLPKLARKALYHYRHGGMRALTYQTLGFLRKQLHLKS